MPEFSFSQIPPDAEIEGLEDFRRLPKSADTAIAEEAGRKQFLTKMTAAAEFRREHVGIFEGKYRLTSLPIGKEQLIETALLLNWVEMHPDFEASALALSKDEFYDIAAQVGNAAIQIRERNV